MGWEWRFFVPSDEPASDQALVGCREDIYFPAGEALGLKLRNGDGALEVKQRSATRPVPGRGLAERWSKTLRCDLVTAGSIDGPKACAALGCALGPVTVKCRKRRSYEGPREVVDCVFLGFVGLDPVARVAARYVSVSVEVEDEAKMALLVVQTEMPPQAVVGGYPRVVEEIAARCLAPSPERGLAPAAAPAAAEPIPVVISCSALLRAFPSADPARLERALFLFGSKRKWLFPADPSEEKEARRQPGRYHTMPAALRELILAKEQRGEVFFLKKPDLAYERYPGPEDPEAYARASAWLEAQGVGPLNVDRRWWLTPDRDTSTWSFCRDPAKVVRNFERGFHEYDELMELLAQSYGPRVRPLLGHELA